MTEFRNERYNRMAPKPFTPVQIIPISKAILCPDCDAITEGQNGHCVACGNRSIVQLEKLLNHEVLGAESGIVVPESHQENSR
jgi:hypothetical protein